MLDAHKDLVTLEPFREPKDLDGEIWRDVEGFARYQISNLGRVKSFWGKTPRILIPKVVSGGYLYVSLSTNAGKKWRYIHRLVAKAFIPNSENKPQVNHINGIKTDNRVENLEWATAAENTQHAFATGLTPQGERRTESKLTNEQARYIRDNPDQLTSAAMAEMFGVAQSVISRVRRGKSYRNAGGALHERFGVPKAVRKEIKQLYIKGLRGFGACALAKKFGVCQRTILNIVKEGD